MIILDTSVVPERMDGQPNQQAPGWFDDRDGDELWTNSVSLADVLFGVNRLPIGRRRALEVAFSPLPMPGSRRFAGLTVRPWRRALRPASSGKGFSLINPWAATSC